MAEEGRKIKGRRVTMETFGELLKAEVDTPQDVDFEAVVIRFDPKNEAELHRLIELGGGPLAWGAPSAGRTMWHRQSIPGGGAGRVSVYMELPPLPRDPVVDPILNGVVEKRQQAEAEARKVLVKELDGKVLDEDLPRAVEALIRKGWKPGDVLRPEMVEDAMTIRPVS